VKLFFIYFFIFYILLLTAEIFLKIVDTSSLELATTSMIQARGWFQINMIFQFFLWCLITELHWSNNTQEFVSSWNWLTTHLIYFFIFYKNEQDNTKTKHIVNFYFYFLIYFHKLIIPFMKYINFWHYVFYKYKSLHTKIKTKK
jgi:hypothetical protein